MENGSIKRMFQNGSTERAIQEAVCFTLARLWLQIAVIAVISQSIKWLITDGILWGL